MKRSVAFVALFFGCLMSGECQQKKLDSLLAINNVYHQEDSLKAIYLREIFRAYNSVKNYAKVDLYIDSAIWVASHLPRKNTLAGIYYRAGSAFHNSDRFRAITYYNKAIETARIAGAAMTEAGGYLNLGALYMGIAEFPKSLEAHEHALELYRRINDAGNISSCYMNMSYIYVNMGQKVKGMEYIKKALKTFEDGGSDRGIAVAYEEIIDLYFTSTDSELSAMGIAPGNRLKEIAVALDKGLKKALLTDDHSLVSTFYSNLGRLNEQQGNILAAQQYYKKSVDINAGNIEEDSYGDNLVLTGKFYIYRLKDFTRGMGMLHTALIGAQKMGRTVTEKDVLTALSEAHEKQHNFDSALFFYRQAIVAKENIYNREKEQEITRRQLKIDFDIKERDYKTAQQLANARLQQQEQEILLRKQLLQISDKEKTLQRLTFLQKQATLENQKKLQATQLKEEQLKAEFERKTSDQQISVQNIQLSSNRRLSVFLAIVAVVVFAAAMFIYNSRRKTVKLNRLVSEQKAALEELVDVKDKIFSVISHDLSGPMNNIAAFSSLLQDGNIEQERLQLYMEQIKSTMDHTSSLMENLLNWSASQMKGFTPVIENVNISTVIQHTLKGMEHALMKKQISVHNMITGDMYVKGDSNMIELIIRNLVSNAIKFSKNEGRLELYATYTDKEVVLSVKDNGMGIVESKVQKINSAAVHSLDSTYGTEKEKGTGLGLMLCKHFAGMMGGSISVTSRQGMGSQFNISLPAAA